MGFLGFLLFLTLMVSQSAANMNGTFSCSSTSTCKSLVGFSPENATTLGAIQSLFQVKDLVSLLGANNFPLSDTRDTRVAANQTIRIPVDCACANGTGISSGGPVYKVKKGDDLYIIASLLFRGLVQAERIGEANRLPNYNLIEVGQELRIPLPCSCDDVDGQDVVHYAHVVKSGSTVGQIAAEFGTNQATLLKLNGLANESQLLADIAFDVPLRACNSSVKSDSPDYPLLVANSSYVVTALNCVRCHCDASNNWTLKCEPSQLKPSNSGTCPSMRCQGQGNLLLGNTTTASCNRGSCAYTGFNNQTIFTSLLTESTCPASGNNFASRIYSSWNLFMLIQLVLFCLTFLD